MDFEMQQAHAYNIITHDGDVNLLVGPDKVRFRVNSHIVRASSIVFDEMFTGHSVHGRKSDRSSPKQIDLPNDNPAAFEVILLVLHHLNDEVTDRMKPRLVFDIALTCNKYELTSAMKYASTPWLHPEYYRPFDFALCDTRAGDFRQPRADQPNVDQARIHLLASALLFRNEVMFPQRAMDMVFRFTGDCVDLLRDPQLAAVFPARLITMLADRRAAARKSIITTVRKRASKTRQESAPGGEEGGEPHQAILRPTVYVDPRQCLKTTKFERQGMLYPHDVEGGRGQANKRTGECVGHPKPGPSGMFDKDLDEIRTKALICLRCLEGNREEGCDRHFG